VREGEENTRSEAEEVGSPRVRQKGMLLKLSLGQEGQARIRKHTKQGSFSILMAVKHAYSFAWSGIPSIVMLK
jgi:hypothetical protein